MTIRLDGKQTANSMMATLKTEITALKAKGVTPGLAVVLVGDDPASAIYVRNKQRRAEELGINSVRRTLPKSATQAEVLAEVATLNQDPSIDGILVQLPLPSQIDENAVIEAIDPAKDVDGFHPLNVGKLWENMPRIIASTPFGIMALLEHYHIDVAGKHAVVLGRSNIVGRPMAALLLNHDATVTIAHSKTQNLFAITKQADILVVATGQAEFITADAVKPGAVVIDVGMDHNAAGKLVGDVDYASVAPVASAITPVPGGVGPMTIAGLMTQTVALAKRRVHE
ncbi:MAG: bifunctional methylenetetrahydrofolate dehydrogenase/methenyltetrahydrofolate cyclohydrolase FolD [Lactobacillus sp.]|jgi:methylenetetrahydrofolate dehydrogenase (NADP+)/methenyltetrahydrofolate cyclohydrolase|uniref:Bifunctional protein FolD n=1 Tax=Lacticaseibacillus suilingensis TaxID=2799577 RepID=A0ABW4BFB7_9LACO|nr:bifunctional methylenetetrahydrofolate dehydrogenase/methenyltetrahydrofolate cyclohydrolase FolD [Lacticaseibacillus suilingensis]MCI1894599.1 bifunctional methylenetetrahydrofolate dehydrogenase/methenyltetrahydrofolate cyclohydrolase FolD [Lactobacillus sp.]MCI1918126.1 bifunctional methylenetetrahydrofolate dehydrogenase/methenyltetrahydrofolate cyclohydrolase FolD [Lactobacillus sp.]MCI1940693.1 bifunctional methylenetetrahydrofolate dehydrogenase/methenyltetrahydrofolate cyclohydrolase 